MGSTPTAGSTDDTKEVTTEDASCTLPTVIDVPCPDTFEDNVDRWISEEAKRNSLDKALLLSVILAESSGNPKAYSKKDAFGLMQLSRATAEDLGVDRYHPQQNIQGGAKLLAKLLRQHGFDKGLAAWNAGPGAVRRWGGVPPFQETRRFLKKVKVGIEVLQ